MMRGLAIACLLLACVGSGCGGSDGATEEAVRTFERGMQAWQASLALEAEGRGTSADPEALKAAVMRAEDALAFWQRAVTLRADWPPARRNVERALLRVEGLREHGRERKPRDAKEKDEPPETKEDSAKPPPATDVTQEDLPPELVLGVLDLLRKREQAKRRLRAAQRRAGSADVERDW